MKDLLWLFPILAAIAVVLGACRGRQLPEIFTEASKSFVKMVLGIAALCVVLQLILFVVPMVF